MLVRINAHLTRPPNRGLYFFVGSPLMATWLKTAQVCKLSEKGDNPAMSVSSKGDI